MQPPCAAKQRSTARIAWALSLLACAGIAVNAFLTHGSHREWWNTVQSEQLQYAQWEASAQREADVLVGEVEGLTREQVIERLTSRLGPDDPYPQLPPSTNGAMPAMAMPLPADPKVEPAVCWNVRAKNWYVIVPVYDGRAKRLTVTTMQRTFVGARAPQAEVLTFYYVIGVTSLIMYLAATAAVAAWWFRRRHRAALHVCLAARGRRMGGAAYDRLGLWNGPSVVSAHTGQVIEACTVGGPCHRPRVGVDRAARSVASPEDRRLCKVRLRPYGQRQRRLPGVRHYPGTGAACGVGCGCRDALICLNTSAAISNE
jgi:hypothetical protein